MLPALFQLCLALSSGYSILNPSSWIHWRMSVCPRQPPGAGDELGDEPSQPGQGGGAQFGDGFTWIRSSALSTRCLLLLQLNVLNNVSSSEDVKPLPGLTGMGNMNYPSTSPGSLAKHICAICGDRSSGRRLYSSWKALCNESSPDALEWGSCWCCRICSWPGFLKAGCLLCKLVVLCTKEGNPKKQAVRIISF